MTYAVLWINIHRMMALTENVCPRVLFTGMPIDYKKELQLAFGDYSEAYKRSNEQYGRTQCCLYSLVPSGQFYGLMGPVEN